MLLLSVFLASALGLQTLPPTEWTANCAGALSLTNQKLIIDADFADHRDQTGLTLIPPSAFEFAETFRQDLEETLGPGWTLGRSQDAQNLSTGGIILGPFRGNHELTLENGLPTEEAYELEINDHAVYIGGTGARGMFWGTRTLLQQILLNGTPLPCGRIVDAPAYSTRGFMLDAGRKWYAPSFLKDLCTYASFFKMSEFHYHGSDNYPLSRGRNETWTEIYSHFSLLPESVALRGLVERPNETLSRAEFEDFQQHCAQRGITVIPEIEAPGHSLAITKWKPELALEGDYDLLNLSYPDTIPTIKAIWAEFLPWFQSKEVHIGADEYDSDLADDYITFVNEMSEYISNYGKRIRIWGTYEPSENLTISKDVVIQHWQYGQSDPVQLQREGYKLINSEDWWAYITLKNDHMPILPAPYPQFYNETRTLNFANQRGWQWNPALFNPVNITEQLDTAAPENTGAIMAAWNDNGPDATTQLEAYYAIRRGIPLVGSRAWSGSRGTNITLSTIEDSLHMLTNKAPAQNLDRRIPFEAVSWSRSQYDSDFVVLGLGSKGMNYTMDLQVIGPFNLTGPDNTLSLGQNGELVFVADGWSYPLRSVSEFDGMDAGLPGRIWANQTSSTHEPVAISTPSKLTITGDVVGGSRVWVDDEFVGRFEVFVYGGRNSVFSWSQMAFVAPVEALQGGIQSLSLRNGIDVSCSPQ